jgi:DNA polymerase-3 subunit delta
VVQTSHAVSVMVAVRARDADAFIAAPPDGLRLFLVYGNDAGGVTERARRLEQIALKRGGGEAVLRFGSDQISADPGRIADEAYSASLFGGEPVISLRILDGRHNVIGALEPLIERPPDAAWVIVEAGELQTTNALRKGFEACPRGAAVPVYQAEGAGLVSLIRAAATEAGVVIEPAALELLAASLGGDRLATRGELEKLFLYVGERGPVTLADVEAIVGNAAELRTDELIDAALSGDSEGLESALDRLRAEGGSPVGLASLALRHLMHLESLRGSVDAGISAGAAVERSRPPFFSTRRNAVMGQIERWPSAELSAARRRMADAIMTTRLISGLEGAAVSQALHETALQARRLRQRA